MLVDAEGEGGLAMLGGSVEDDPSPLLVVFMPPFRELLEGVSLILIVFIAISSQTKHCLY